MLKKLCIGYKIFLNNEEFKNFTSPLCNFIKPYKFSNKKKINSHCLLSKKVILLILLFSTFRPTLKLSLGGTNSYEYFVIESFVKVYDVMNGAIGIFFPSTSAKQYFSTWLRLGTHIKI